ncbi:hypothetical protein N7G274_005519 [Stereocaulon virgatum]|uniref:FAD linked oxidase N-terminal domain-containing protein n=1 Tax=Stereocaulon virgatum TaxID=373712 RepID=A0ABR4A7F2_9LECA
MHTTYATDLSTTLLFCLEHSIDFATQGGGRATSGASSSDGGIVIDLSEMRDVTVSPVDKTITAQDVGANGLTIDDLLSVRIVLANGSIIRSSETENADLFWALRGAGQSFDVVTEFTYRAHPQPNPVWAGTLIFSPGKLVPLTAFTNHLSSISHPKVAIIIGFAAPAPLHTPLLLAVVLYNGPKAAALSLFEPLLSLNPVMKEIFIIPYSAANSLLNPGTAHSRRKVTIESVFTYSIRPQFVRSLFNKFITFLQETPDVGASMLGFEIYSTDKICQVSNQAMAFANRGTYGSSCMPITWTQKENDFNCRVWARKLSKHFKSELEPRKKRMRGQAGDGGRGRVWL